MADTLDGSELFRREVIEAQSRRLHGVVILRQSLPTRIMTAGIVIVVLLVMVWIVFGRYSRIETARGMLIPIGGYSKVYALHAGVVASLLVKDGDMVKAGDKLAIVKIEAPDASGKVGTEEVLRSVASQTLLATQQIAFASQRSQGEAGRLTGIIDGMRKQAAELADQISLQKQIVRSMTESFDAVAPVVQKGYISKLEYERRRQALLGAQEDLVRLRQQADSTQADIVRSEKEREQALLAGKNDQANAKSTLETLHQQRTKVEGEGSYLVVAPVSGRVTGLQTGTGRTVEDSVPLMALIPDGAPLKADLFVPSRAIGFVKAGQEVRLLYDAFPYQRFGSYRAHINMVARLAISGPETGAPFEIKDPVYRVTVSLDQQDVQAYGRKVALQPGMTLVANIILERQSFLDWILDPLRSVSNRT